MTSITTYHADNFVERLKRAILSQWSQFGLRDQTAETPRQVNVPGQPGEAHADLASSPREQRSPAQSPDYEEARFECMDSDQQQTGNGAPRLGVLVAFSGGPDSTALLTALHLLTEELHLQLHAAHVNHNLRAAESDDDEQYCRELCSSLSIPLHVHSLVGTAADEASLREARYNYLLRLCDDNAIPICATGHTLNDQVETVLFRLFRGSALRGLCGIQSLRLRSERGTFIARPMLEFYRQDCLNFLASRNIEPRFDSSNLHSSYARNYIRNCVIPVIETRFPGAVTRIERARVSLVDDERELESTAEQIVQELDQCRWQVSYLEQLSLSMLRRVLLSALERHRIEPSFFRINQLINVVVQQTTASLNDQWDATIHEGRLLWLDKQRVGSIRPLDEMPSYVVRIPGLSILHRLNLCVRVQKLEEPPTTFPTVDEWEMVADLSRISGTVCLRARQPGDRIQPLGMPVSVRLKKFIHTRKSAKLLRFAGHTLLLADDIDVVWVPGCGLSERMAARGSDSWRVSISSIAPDTGGFC